jgi:hypothetical protein
MGQPLVPGRRAGLALAILGALVLSACGSTAAPSSASGTPTPAATPAAAVPTSTPGPSSIEVTLSGDKSLAGPLVKGTSHFVTCEEPSLTGETILAYENSTDPSVGVLMTIRASSIQVRLAKSSGGTFAARTFDGTGVTFFSAAQGAKFTSSLTETTPSTLNKGTVKAISSISGSVSCGTFTPGSASVTVAGDTAVGPITGGVTSARVLCGSNTAGRFATVTGLGKLGSTPAVVSLVGGSAGAPFYVILQTTSATYQYSSSAAGAVKVSSAGATYNATVTESAPAAGAAPKTLTVSGSATCGS